MLFIYNACFSKGIEKEYLKKKVFYKGHNILNRRMKGLRGF